MTQRHAQFDGSIPELYDWGLGPVLFEVPAADLARRVETLGVESRLLEIACGTGISTAHLRRALPAGVEIEATDLNPAMLEVERRKHEGVAGVSFSEADALDLPFADDSFDAVACQFGIMFFPDKARGLAEMARVLRPGGGLVFNVWDSLAHNPAPALAGRRSGEAFDSGAPGFLQIPFGFHAIDPVKALLEDVGFEQISVHIVSATVESADPHRVARGFVEGNPGVHELRERGAMGVAEVVATLERSLIDTFGPVPLRIPIQEIVYTARRPAV